MTCYLTTQDCKMIYYLKANNETELWYALSDAGLVILSTEGDGWQDQSITLDIIGTIYNDSGEVDEEGNPVMVAEDGFFANMIADEGLELDIAIPEPTTPYRIFAGA